MPGTETMTAYEINVTEKGCGKEISWVKNLNEVGQGEVNYNFKV